MPLRFAVIVFLSIAASFAVPARASGVAGGWEVSWATHPWAVSVGDDECGGVLVGPDRVVTSTRCAFDILVPEKIRVGTQRRYIVAVAMHPDWVRQGHDRAYGCRDDETLCMPDIALLGLDRPIRGLALPTPAPARAGERAIVVGHGTTGLDDDESAPARLRAAVMEVHAHGLCRRLYPRPQDLALMPSATTLCLTDPTPPRNAGICVGDGGAPLLSGRRLFGIGSWSRDCGAADTPSIFTAVAPYRRFIRSTATEWRPETRGDATFTGSTTVGSRLRCHPPTFSNQPDRITFTFIAYGPGAYDPRLTRQSGSSNTYVVREDDRGRYMTCSVIASNHGGFAEVDGFSPIVR